MKFRYRYFFFFLNISEIWIRESYLEGFPIDSRRLLNERQEKMSREFVGGWYLEVAVEKFAKSLVIDVLEQKDSLLIAVVYEA